MSERIADGVFITLVAILVSLGGYWLTEWAQPVQAAPSKPDACELSGTTGAIVVYYCEPENGPPYYVNNVGFMVVAE